MEAKAVNRFVGSSPRKMRLVIDLVRGLTVDRAIEVLHFQPKHASKDAEKTLRSAFSNLMNKDDNIKIEPGDAIIKECFVDVGPVAKRIQPAPMGRAYRVRKRSCHITIIVATKDVAAKN
jgi:large subunit ribosomal protein L22